MRCTCVHTRTIQAKTGSAPACPVVLGLFASCCFRASGVQFAVLAHPRSDLRASFPKRPLARACDEAFRRSGLPPSQIIPLIDEYMDSVELSTISMSAASCADLRWLVATSTICSPSRRQPVAASARWERCPRPVHRHLTAQRPHPHRSPVGRRRRIEVASLGQRMVRWLCHRRTVKAGVFSGGAGGEHGKCVTIDGVGVSVNECVTIVCVSNGLALLAAETRADG